MTKLNTNGKEQIIKFWHSKNPVDKAIYIVLGALFIVSLAFSGYYYFDRYVNLDNKTPAELSAENLEHAVRQDPQNVDIRISLAMNYLESGKYKEAQKESLQVIESYPDRDEPLFIYGLASYEVGDFADAVEFLGRFIEIRLQVPMGEMDAYLQTALYFVGVSYLELGMPEEAAASFQESLHINTMDADSYYQLGVAYSELGDHENAVNVYLRATDFVPDFLEAYQGLIESYAALDNAGMVAYARGMEALTLGDYQTAETHLLSAVESYPELARGYIGLAMVYEQTADYDTALENVNKAIELDPNNFLANNILGRINFILGKE